MADNTRSCDASGIPDETVEKSLEGQIASLDPQRAAAFAGLQTVRTTRASGYAREQRRLALKYGSDNPRVGALADRIRSNAGLLRDIGFEQTRAGTGVPAVDQDGYVFHGFVRDRQGKGLPDLTVALYDDKGNWIREIGFGCTDAQGYFLLRYQGGQRNGTGTTVNMAAAGETDAKPTTRAATAAQLNARIHVLDAAQKTLQVEAVPLHPVLGQVDFRIIVLGARDGGVCTMPPPVAAPAPTPAPAPGAGAGPAPTPPASSAPRTPLDKLEIDATTRKRLDKGGIVDVEGILEADPARVAEIVGDRAVAAKLLDQARSIVPADFSVARTGPETAPAPSAARRKKTRSDKP